MKTTVMTPSALAHHLRIAANQYDRDATQARDHGTEHPEQKDGMESLARTFDDQARQARAWADAWESAGRIGFEGDDIGVEHD